MSWGKEGGGKHSALIGATSFPLVCFTFRKNEKCRLWGVSKRELRRDARKSLVKKVESEWLKKGFLT